MNANDNPDSTAPLPGHQDGDFETFVRNTLSLIITQLDSLQTIVDQLSLDQRDRYVDLRLCLTALDEKFEHQHRSATLARA